MLMKHKNRAETDFISNSSMLYTNIKHRMDNIQMTIKNIDFEGVPNQHVCGRLEGTRLTIIKNIDFEGVQNQLVCGRLEGTKLNKSIETDHGRLAGTKLNKSIERDRPEEPLVTWTPLH